jgi:hypothetical protein
MTVRLKKDDGTEVEVEWEVESYGEGYADCPGSICDGGGEAPTINVISAHNLVTGAEVELTPAERERFEAWILENIPIEPPSFEDEVYD